MGSSGKPPRICVIGAGFSGMWAFIQLKTKLNLTDIDVFDLNKDVGGVWYSHSYPGCTCDLPAYLYCFSFDPITDSKTLYSSRDTLFKYLKNIAGKYGMYEHIHFEHQVNKLSWNEDKNKWIAEITNTASGKRLTNSYDFVITATGIFRNPRVPEEFYNFKGPLIHTALWDSSIPIKNKRIAVVGSGPSGSQVLPELAKVAKKVVLYQRKPSYILPKFDYNLPSWINLGMKLIPLLPTLYYLFYEIIWRSWHTGSWLNTKYICDYMRVSQLQGRDDLKEAFKPKYEFGCTQVLVSDNFYQAFLLPNVKLVTSSIVKVTDNSILTEDGQEDFDILICATGFHVKEYFAPMEIFTTEGEELSRKWKEEGPSLFMGVLNHQLPNLFVIQGPFGTPVNSLLNMIELQVDFVIKCLKEALSRRSRKVAVKKACEKEYMERILGSLKKMVWSAAACSPWSADDKGRIIAIFPDAFRKFRSDVSTFVPQKVLDFK